ncbi:MAG: cysteine--tRNA ligase [Waddliaceae bacterium]|nr:cysteine--tRNA ligase [Waddliaceae bacterium]
MSIKTELRLFNTETRTKEPLKTMQANYVKLYTCGPTVYDYAHIGNFRTYIFEDLLRRTLSFMGYQVEQVMNLTDVDDKTIRGAIKQGVTLDEYTQPYKDSFFEDLDTLGIQRAEHYPAATEYVPEMIAFIQDLIEKGVAYQGADGSVYFSIQQFPRYGCLSHLRLDELEAGRSNRISSDEYEKDCVADFVLWKALDAERDGNIYWESPFGKGRPGWHLECSTMAMSILGETVDIHVGGVDNMFPHHENEIAQSECRSGKRFANLWMHSEHLIVNNKKMSKSLGNFYTLRDLLKQGYEGAHVRYLLLSTHYKTQLNFTLDGLAAAKASLQRVNDFIARIKEQEGAGDSSAIDRVLEDAMEKFYQALADDLNISVALASVFDLVREVNALVDAGKVGKIEAEKVVALMQRFDEVLCVFSFEQEETKAPQELEEALVKRQQARADKNWALADELRDLIQSRGYIILDGPEGSKLKKTEESRS